MPSYLDDQFWDELDAELDSEDSLIEFI